MTFGLAYVDGRGRSAVKEFPSPAARSRWAASRSHTIEIVAYSDPEPDYTSLCFCTSGHCGGLVCLNRPARSRP